MSPDRPDGHRTKSDDARWRGTLVRLTKSRASRTIAWQDLDSIAPPPALPRKLLVGAVSQLYYAERAAERMCAWLDNRVPEPEARACVGRQRSDETRHAALYLRYLSELGAIAAIDPALSDAVDLALDGAPSHHALMAVLHIVLEGESLVLHGVALGAVSCPEFAAIARAVRRDEARHVAFGRLYLAHTLPGLPFDQRLALLRHVRAVWSTAMTSGSRGGALAAAAPRSWRSYEARRWAVHLATLTRLGLAQPDDPAPLAAT